MPETTYGDISPRSAGVIVAKLLERNSHATVTEVYGQIDPQPKNATDTRRYRRYNTLARASAPLSEGISPAGTPITATDVVATLELYGDFVPLTKKTFDLHDDNVPDAVVDVMAEQISETIEEVRLNVLKSGSNVVFANAGTSRAGVNSPLTRGDLRVIERTLNRNKAKQISRVLSATPGIGTEPVEAAYFCIAHNDLKADIRNITGFIPVAKYSRAMNAQPNEFGSVEGFRFILTGMVDPFLTAGTSGTTFLSGGDPVTSNAQADVYPMLFFGRDAYGIVPLTEKGAITPAVVRPKPMVGDEIGQAGFISWSSWQTAVILNQGWLIRAEVAATANPS